MTQEKIQAAISGKADEKADDPFNEEIAPFWLAALIDSADDAIVSKTLDGIITSWNKGAERIFGYRAEEVIGKPVLILIPPDHQDEEPEILSRIKSGERIEHYETVRRRKDGSLVDISLTVSPIMLPDGRIVGASKIARDISALKQAERTLRESENQLRIITDAIPALVSYVDREGFYRFANQSYTDWFGVSHEEIIGRHLREVIGEAGFAAILPNLERVFKGEKFAFEQLMPYPEGEKIVHVNYIPDFDEETGNVRGFCALVQDISESKKAEARLRESEARFSKAFNASPLVLTISSLETGKLLEVNDTFVSATGFSREEAIGKTTVELGLWAKPKEREEEMETVRQSGHIRNAEYVFKTRNGEIVGLLSAEHIEIGGESFALTVIQDITERKRAEEKLRQSDARLRLAIDISRTSMFDIDLLTDEVQTDDIGREIYGFEKDEPLTFTKVQSHFHADDREEVGRAVSAALAPGGENEFEVEQRIIRTDGETRWIRVRGRAFFEGKGEKRRAVRCLGTYIDITAHKRADEKLRESEERYRMLFNSIDQGFCVCEVIFDEAGNAVDYRFLEVNPVFEQMTGISYNQALSEKTARELVPSLEDKWIKMYGQIALTGEPVSFVDGSDAMNGRWFDVYAFRVGDEPSRKVAIFFNNITESKLAEDRLRESEENLRYTVELNPQVPWTARADGMIESFSDSWLEMTGMTREDALGEGWSQVPHPDDAQKMQVAWMHSIKTGAPYDVEHRIRLADGSYRWMRSRAFPRLGENGEIIRWYGTTEDIHKRKLAEESLRQSRERLQMAMDAAQIYSWEMNLATQEIQWSNNLEHVIGFPLPTGYEVTVNDLVHADDRDLITRKIQRAIEKRENFESEFRLVNPEAGEIVWVRGQGVLIDDITDDRQPRFVGITQNITERKQAEQEREKLLLREQIARQQAEEASRLKDEFLATVSHEIRTPLNAILGWSQVLMTNKIGAGDVSGAIETIYRNAKSQAQLIEDILDVSRIITGKIRLDARPISLAPLIQTAVESLRPAIEAKNIHLQMRLDFEPRMVNADPNRLQQVVWNLLSNAIKFTPEKGSVSIELESDESKTKIIVSDTGKGISAEFLPFVFERFRQADGSSTRKHGGLGLGLAIVRHIVELHGGSVEVESEGEDKGTTFTVYLPLSESVVVDSKNFDDENRAEGSNETEQNASFDSKIKGLRVLLVDDETDTLELLSVVLTQNGAEVKSETGAAAALEVIKNWQPDVIISDIAMPDEDGYSLIKKLRALPIERGGAIPAIALTAYVGIKEQTQVLASGFQMYLPKPIDPSELVEALAKFA